MVHNKKFVILISGPTATGKTNMALQLGMTLPIEIINADIGSFYTHLNIGTAKPDWKKETIPHHFFDVIHDNNSWTAPQFREQLKELIDQIWKRGNIPVVVGGSAFYIQSFFYKNHILQLPSEELLDSLEKESSDHLWQTLYSIDPQRAEKINRNDHYRLVRALAIWYTQGQKPSEFEQIFDPIAPFYFISLTRDRDQLYQMIDERVDIMMKLGWLDEVRSLLHDESWVDFMMKKKMIGYDLLAQYLLGYHAEQELKEIIDLIAQRTRNYAKRQITFLKKLVTNIKKDQANHEFEEIRLSKIEECNLTLCDLSLYIKQLSERISQFLK
ncbi:MAG: tRNA (adenosine(37)-N6)-dimethylallyltransferase MiaA [Candidatus Dependentiae bacterium]|nr:tRNA (adenosine(37)-N6)-dimethylallyltransferase MiaA [Candidatus Dependentiae bacterium]